MVGKNGRDNSKKFSIYLYKVLKQVHPDTGISNKAMQVMNDFVLDCFARISSEVGLFIIFLKYIKSKMIKFLKALLQMKQRKS